MLLYTWTTKFKLTLMRSWTNFKVFKGQCYIKKKRENLNYEIQILIINVFTGGIAVSIIKPYDARF